MKQQEGVMGVSHQSERPEGDPSIMSAPEEHDELRKVVVQLLERQGDHESVRRNADSELGYSEQLWRTLNDELEIGALAMPESVGGHGFGFRELGVILEQTGAALLPEPILGTSVVACQAFTRADRPEELSDLLARAIRGEITIAYARKGNLVLTRAGGRNLVSGVVESVLGGATCDALLARATIDSGSTLVLVWNDGLSSIPRETVDLTRPRADVACDGAAAMVVVDGMRADTVLQELDMILDAAVAVEHAGIVDRLLDMTIKYVSQRTQFGRSIGSYQAIKHRLADILVDRERSRSATRYAMAALDEDIDAAGFPVAVASAVAMDAAIRTAHEAVQLHGGIGFTWEHPAHYYLRRVLADEGTFASGRTARSRIADMLGV